VKAKDLAEAPALFIPMRASSLCKKENVCVCAHMSVRFVGFLFTENGP